MRERVDFRVSFLVFLALWMSSELALRLGNARVWAGGRRELVSAQLLDDRLKALQPLQGKRLLLLGDSVFYGSALREKGIANWRSATVPAAFSQDPAWRGWQVLDFSGDGLNPPDLDALLRSAEALKPDAVVVELNYRMLAEKAGQGDELMAHPWLAPRLEGPLRSSIEAGLAAKNLDSRLSEGMVAFLRNYSYLFRYAELGGALLINPSARELAGKAVSNVFPPQDNSDQNDVLLDFKIRPYYAAPAAGPGHLGLAALKDIHARLAALGVPALVFLTPQNRDRVSDFLDQAAFKKNRALMAASFPSAGRLVYRDWADERVSGQFLDHCHWDAQGNRELEAKLTRTLRQACKIP